MPPEYDDVQSNSALAISPKAAYTCMVLDLIISIVIYLQVSVQVTPWYQIDAKALNKRHNLVSFGVDRKRELCCIVSQRFPERHTCAVRLVISCYIVVFFRREDN